MKKKTLALTMAMALVLSLAACGNSNADVAAEATAGDRQLLWLRIPLLQRKLLMTQKQLTALQKMQM